MEDKPKKKRNPSRKSISLSQLCYARLTAAANERGVPRSELVEDALAAVFSGAPVRDSEGNEYRLPYRETGDAS